MRIAHPSLNKVNKEMGNAAKQKQSLTTLHYQMVCAQRLLKTKVSKAGKTTGKYTASRWFGRTG